MTNTERDAIVARVMGRHFAGQRVTEAQVRAAADEIRQGFEAADATFEQIRQFILGYALSILDAPGSLDEMTAAIRAMADGFKVEIVMVEADDGQPTLTVRPWSQH